MKMNFKKKLLALILAMVLLMSIPVISASAVGADDIYFDDNEIVYDNHDCCSNDYIDDSSAVNMPDDIIEADCGNHVKEYFQTVYCNMNGWEYCAYRKWVCDKSNGICSVSGKDPYMIHQWIEAPDWVDYKRYCNNCYCPRY